VSAGAGVLKYVPIHWHEFPAFIRIRARDKGIDLGGDGHTPRLITKRDAQGGRIEKVD
jgi:hypothetical protein